MYLEMRYIFADHNADFIEEMKKLLIRREDCTFIIGDVKQLKRPHRAFVTLANSLLYMDSGIDRVYSRQVFPGSEPKLREFIKGHGKVSLVGKPHLPIGSAVMLEAERDHFLIAASTMLMPQPVINTRNAYHATLAALIVAGSKPDVNDIVISAACCGWGRMKPQDSARQCWWALLDFEAGLGRGKIERFKDITMYSSTDDFMREQPDFYENSEFKLIPARHVIQQ